MVSEKYRLCVVESFDGLGFIIETEFIPVGDVYFTDVDDISKINGVELGMRSLTNVLGVMSDNRLKVLALLLANYDLTNFTIQPGYYQADKNIVLP